MAVNIASSDTNDTSDNTNRNINISSVKKEWDGWRTNSYTVMPHVSPQSKKIAENYRLRPSDVVILTFPKTGTTWTQTVCEQIRTNGEGYEGFGDITERQPWLEFAYDCGQNLDDEVRGIIPQDQPIDAKSAKESETNPPSRGSILTPRIFKSHQLLSAINPGAKYLCIVRDPASTLLSWFDFQKTKGRPGYAEYEDANEYIANQPELFSGNHIFGTNLWEMFAEIWCARNDPSVKTLVYEGLIADATNGYKNHFPVIADFLGCSRKSSHKLEQEQEAPEHELYERIAALVSREEMVKHVNRFDDHFIAEMGGKYGRALKIMKPAPKVRSKGGGTELSKATLEWLEDQWLEKMTPKTGHTTYDEFATDLSELLFADEETNQLEKRDSTTSQGVSEPRQAQKSSILMRRKSSLVIEQMPVMRRRRESIAPLE